MDKFEAQILDWTEQFTGRAEELRLLHGFTDRLLLVTGPAGVGKTVLLAHFARETAAPRHFLLPGKSRQAEVVLDNLGRQLASQYQLDYPGSLSAVLEALPSTPTVVVDGLESGDEGLLEALSASRWHCIVGLRSDAATPVPGQTLVLSPMKLAGPSPSAEVDQLLSSGRVREAVETARRLDDVSARDGSLLSVGRFYLQGGSIQSAEDIASSLGDWSLRVTFLLEIAAWYRSRGRTTDALDTLNRSHQLATALLDPWHRCECLAQVALASARHQLTTEAQRLAEWIEAELSDCDNPDQAARILARLAQVAHACGDTETCDRLLTDALSEARGEVRAEVDRIRSELLAGRT